MTTLKRFFFKLDRTCSFPLLSTVNSRSGRGARAARSLQMGFTLIELMVVVGLVAILTAIAMPSYTDYIKRGQIVDGLVPLADMGGKMEQFFQDNRTYAGACESNTVAPKPADSSRFSYSCGNLAKSTFTVTATGKGSMQGFVFTLDQSGMRQTTGTPSGWTAGGSCWSIRKDGSC